MIAVVVVLLVVICNIIIVRFAENCVFDNVDDVPVCEYAVLLGTTPMSRYGKKNTFFTNRINATMELYRAGKFKKLIISGDKCSLDGCNEPREMCDTLVARGLPKNIIMLDGTGFSTVNSVENAKKEFGLDSCISISQKFHNERFVYLANGYDLKAVGYNAESPQLIGSMLVYVREWFARVKVFVDLSKCDNFAD